MRHFIFSAVFCAFLAFMSPLTAQQGGGGGSTSEGSDGGSEFGEGTEVLEFQGFTQQVSDYDFVGRPNANAPTAVAYQAVATYQVGAGGAGCSATTSNYVYYQATCPYTGSDLVAGSCYRSGDKTAQNWRATINDTRVTTDLATAQGRKYYDIVQTADSRWWLAQNLDYRKGLTFRQASNSPSTVTGSNTALMVPGRQWRFGNYIYG